MKKLAFLFGIALFASPFVASAAIGAGCNVDAECDATTAGEWCDNGPGGTFLCKGPSTTSNTSTNPSTGGGQFVPLAPIPGLTEGVNTTSSDMAAFLNNLYKFLIGFAAAAAVVMIIWGGLEYATQDSPGGKSEGKSKIYQAILGLILVLLPVIVFSIINPRILDLSVSWKTISLPTNSGAVTGGGKTAPVSTGTSAAITAGCTVAGTLLQTATCPTAKAAQDFATSCSTGSGSVATFTSQNVAYCSTLTGSATGPYGFIDTASTAGLVGTLNLLTGYSYYEPLESTLADPNNGRNVVNFGNTCHADGGTTCMSNVKLPCAQNIVTLISGGASATCWAIQLSCVTAAYAFQYCPGGYSSSPSFKPVK